jgi:hypothetical protein
VVDVRSVDVTVPLVSKIVVPELVVVVKRRKCVPGGVPPGSGFG